MNERKIHHICEGNTTSKELPLKVLVFCAKRTFAIVVTALDRFA